MFLYFELIFFTVSVTSMRFFLHASPHEPVCFFLVLEISQKYSLQIVPHNSLEYFLDVGVLRANNLIPVLTRTSSSDEPLLIHKVASHSGTHRMCFTNKDHSGSILRLSLAIQSGMQLLQFSTLPREQDVRDLSCKVDMLEGHMREIERQLGRMQGLELISMDYANTIDFFLLEFALFGLFVLLFVNVIFYFSVKTELKRRKMI